MKKYKSTTYDKNGSANVRVFTTNKPLTLKDLEKHTIECSKCTSNDWYYANVGLPNALVCLNCGNIYGDKRMTEELKTKLRIWAYERMWDTINSGSAPEDDWHEVDASIPELEGKLDVNIFYGLDGIIRACAYDVITDDKGMKTTNCETWIEVF